MKNWERDPRDVLAVGEDFDLLTMDRKATPGWLSDKVQAGAYLTARGADLAELQERLYANGLKGMQRSVLIVVQGLDTAGKGGIARHVMGMVDPQGVKLTAFKAPTAEEKSHGYLWRIRAALPKPGYIGFFDRSHYEDILVPRSLGTLDDTALATRASEIANFEAELMAGGMRILKFALMVSYAEQGQRLLERLENPAKYWKYSPNDLKVRRQWDIYQRVYQEMLTSTSTLAAPWYVIPADRKWYSRLAVTEIISRTLEEMHLHWPSPEFDVRVERELLRELM